MEMNEVVHCRRCHRRLKNAKMKLQGIGNTCLKKELAEKEAVINAHSYVLFEIGGTHNGTE